MRVYLQLRYRAAVLAVALLFGAVLVATADAQTVRAPYDASYTVVNLGSPSGVPAQLGGLTFQAGNPNVLLIGGGANGSSGKLYALPVVRDAGQHVTGFAGAATPFGDGVYNDGGVAYGPGGVLFLTQYPVNKLGQIKPGETTFFKTTDLNALSVASSVGAINFVPAGFPGAGQAKIVSYNSYRWYTLTLAPDGAGTYDVAAATYSVTTQGGPEGFVYVPQGSPLFSNSSMLVSEYQAGVISAFEVDANGDPQPQSRKVFVEGLSGAEGAVIDPLTGDFIFSTFGGGNRVVAVRGFTAPPSTTTTTTATTSTTTTITVTTTTTTTTSTTTTTLPQPCESSPECDDGDVCNGTEICVERFCAAPAVVKCSQSQSIAAVSLYGHDAVAFVDTTTRETIDTVAVGHHPWGVAWEPSGRRVWVSNRADDTVTPIDPVALSAGTPVAVGREPLGIAVDPAGARLYVANQDDDSVSVVDTATSVEVGRIRVGDGPLGVAVNPAGTRVYVGNYRAGTVSVIDTASARVVDTIGVGGLPFGVAVSPDGAKVYVADTRRGRVVVIGTVSNTVTGTVRVGRQPIGVTFSRDGARAFVTCAGDDAVAVLDAGNDGVLARVHVGRFPMGVATDRLDGPAWIAASTGNVLSLLEGTTGALVDQATLGDTPVAFGRFIGELPQDCPARELTCDDGDPFTRDACGSTAGCSHTPLEGLDAVAAGSTELASLAQQLLNPDDPLVRKLLTRIPLLRSSVLAAQTGSGNDTLRPVRRELARIVQVIESDTTRRSFGFLARRLLDLARATRAAVPRAS